MNLDLLESDYERDGVAKIPNLLSACEIEELRHAIEAYRRNLLSSLPPKDYVLEDDGKTVRNLWRMNQHDSYFDHLARTTRMTQWVDRLVRGQSVAIAVELFNKPARVGSGVPPHQDNAYFCLSPPDTLTVWIAVDEVTEENGPIFYVPGSHRRGLLPHAPSGVSGNSMGLRNPPECEAPIVGLLGAGDALIHHCETIHYSAPNTSGRSRRGLLLVYRGSHCVADPELKKAYAQAG